MLSLLYCSPSMLRDPKNKPLASELFIPPSQNLLQPNDLALYQKMLREFDDTDDLIWDTEQRTKQQNPMEGPSDYLFAYKLIIEGCRSLVLAQCGFKEQALASADKCIQFCKILQGRITFWALPLALAYAIQVSGAMNSLLLFQDGLSLLEYFPAYFMFIPPMYHTLTFRIIPFMPSHMPPDQSHPDNSLPPLDQQSHPHPSHVIVQTANIYDPAFFQAQSISEAPEATVPDQSSEQTKADTYDSMTQVDIKEDAVKEEV